MSHFGRAGPPDIRDTYSLLVLNITFRTSADDLFPLFDRYGKVVDIFIPRDRRTGESRGFAFVRYKYAEEAHKAIERLDGRNVDGRDMVVQYAKYGRDMETIARGKITQGSPKWKGSRSRSRSPRRGRSPVRGGRRDGPGSRPNFPSPSPRGRDFHQSGPQHSRRYRDDHRDRGYRQRSRSRDRQEHERVRERDRDRHQSLSRSRSRSRGRNTGEDNQRTQGKIVGRKASSVVRSPSPGRSASRSMSRSPKRVVADSSKEPKRNGDESPPKTGRFRSRSPRARSLSPESRGSSQDRNSVSPTRKTVTHLASSGSPSRRVASLSPESQSL